MGKKEHDALVTAIAAKLGSPTVVAEIDQNIEDYKQAMITLGELRGVAVRLHGELSTPKAPAFDGTLAGLIERYRTDERSPFQKVSHASRRNYEGLLRRLKEDLGHEVISEWQPQTIQGFHEKWSAGGKLAMAHSLMTMLRGVVSFGWEVLQDDQCERLSVILHRTRIEVVKGETIPLTAAHAKLFINKAREVGLYSMALAQAIQFEGSMSQKDVIGEWVPIEEDTPSDVFSGGNKWIRGIRWENIDKNLVLRHAPRLGGSEVFVVLSGLPMVMSELETFFPLPKSGPVIVAENTALPYFAFDFRRKWRTIARAAGIPDEVKNRASKVGASADEEDED